MLTVNSSSKNIFVERALKRSEFQFLTLEQFISATNYPVDGFMVDNFFHNLDKDINIYITPSFLEYFGYSGDVNRQKELFLKTLKSNFENGSDYWIYSNNEYKNFYDKVSEVINSNFKEEDPIHHMVDRNSPSVDTEAVVIKSPEFPDPKNFIGVTGKNTTKHVVLTVKCFKKFLMILNTKKANTVREFYLMLEELITDYGRYQNLWLQTDAAKKDARIDALIADLRNSNKLAEKSNQLLEETRDDLRNSNRLLEETQQDLRNSNNILEETRQELHEANERLESLQEDFETSEDVLTNKIDNISRKLDIAVEDRVVKSNKRATHENFILYSLNDPESEYTHIVARVQNRSLTRSSNNIATNYPNSQMILHLKATPNANALYANVKEKIKGPIYKGQYINIDNAMTEARFIAAIQKVYNDKKIVVLPE